MVRFTVTDTGIGIDKASRERMFQEFSQGDASTRRRFGGTGLGLAISRRLVALMGGEIGFDSEEGNGTTFWFTVNVEARSGVTHDARLGRGKRILITDDNRTNRIILEEFLCRLGAEVVATGGAHEALQAVDAAEKDGRLFDLAILDYQMPVVDGLMLARKLSGDPRLASMKVMLLTSATPPNLSEDAKAANIASVLTKPARREVFINTLASLLNPLLNPSEQGARESRPAAPRTTHRRFSGHVLLVEDNPANQKVGVLMLQRLGLKVSVAVNGVEAVKAYGEHVFDLILMDYQMPEMDGIEATIHIRTMEQAGQHTPIVALTANVLAGEREKCLTARMDDFLAKPIRPEELSAMLEAWLPKVLDAAEKADPLDREVRRLGTKVQAFITETYSDLEGADLKEVLEILERTTLPTFDEFESELLAGDLEAAARTLHRLRNSVGAVGAAELSNSLLSMEKSLREGSPAEANQQLLPVRVSCEALTTVLSRIIDETPA